MRREGRDPLPDHAGVVNLINMSSWGVLSWVYPVWESLGFMDLGDYVLPHFREVFKEL